MLHDQPFTVGLWFLACRKTKVGNYDITQLRPPRFIGQPKVRYVAPRYVKIILCPCSSLLLQFVSPYSPHKAEGYALFLVSTGSPTIVNLWYILSLSYPQALENGRLSGDGDIYFDFVELEESPLRNLLVTNKLVHVLWNPLSQDTLDMRTPL